MSKLTALGLELEYDADDMVITPYNAVVIAEGFDAEGDIRHVVMKTRMTNVQAGGLVNFAKIWTDLNVMNDLVRSVYSEEE